MQARVRKKEKENMASEVKLTFKFFYRWSLTYR